MKLGEKELSRIETTLSLMANEQGFSGVFLLAKGDNVLAQKAFDFADQKLKTRNKLSTQFLIGSITKTFTSMLVLLQVQAGSISLDGKLSEYFSNYRKDIGD